MQPSSLKGYVDSDARVDRLRRANRLRAVQAELNLEEAEAQREADIVRRHRAAGREQAMADALHEEQTIEERRAKMVQRVRAEAPEVRDLEKKLLAAYTAKQRAGQMEEQRFLKEQDAQRRRDEQADIERHFQQQEAKEQEKLRLQREKLLKEQEEAQAAIAAKTMSSAEAALQYRQEKKEVDAIVAKLQEEDYLQQLQRAEQQRTLRDQHETFMSQLEERKSRELEMIKEEERAIAQYMADMSKRKATDERLKRERENHKAKVLAQQAELIEVDRKRKEELESLVEELYAEQASAKARDAAEAERRKKMRDREDMIAANEAQLAHKAMLKKQRLAEEQAFRQKMMEKFAEDERIEQMTVMKKKQMKVEHASKVTELIEAKRKQQEDDDRREQLLAEQRRVREAEWEEIVREERKRLLREHAANLVDRLPKGSVTNAEEHDVVMDALRGEANRIAELGATRGRF